MRSPKQLRQHAHVEDRARNMILILHWYTNNAAASACTSDLATDHARPLLHKYNLLFGALPRHVDQTFTQTSKTGIQKLILDLDFHLPVVLHSDP